MLFLAVAALIMPAIYALVQGGGLPADRCRDRGLRQRPRRALHRRGDSCWLSSPTGPLTSSPPHSQGPLQPGRSEAEEPTKGLRAPRPQVLRSQSMTIAVRGRCRRPGLRDPGRLDLRGVRVHRHLSVLRRHHRCCGRGECCRALGRGPGCEEGQDGSGREHLDRLGGAGRALRGADPGAASFAHRSQSWRSSTASSSWRAHRRDRELRRGSRVELWEGHPAPGRVLSVGAGVPLRSSGRSEATYEGGTGTSAVAGRRSGAESGSGRSSTHL